MEILGARILRRSKELDNSRAICKREIPPTINYLRLGIARSDGKDSKEEWAAILLVDGLRQLLDRDGDSSVLIEVLKMLSDAPSNIDRVVRRTTEVIEKHYRDVVHFIQFA